MDKPYKIEVVFRKWPDGTIDSLFPYEAEFDYKIMCYSRIGQHCIADYDYVMTKTRPAKIAITKHLKKVGN